MAIKKVLSLSVLFVLVIITVLLAVQIFGDKKSRESEEYVSASDFGADGEDLEDDAKAIQKAIDHSHSSKIGKVRLTGNHHYVIKSGLHLKEGVELELGQNTKIYVEGNFRAIVLEKNASITNGIIEVTNAEFNSEVIYLNGREKFWSAERTRVHNVAIINSSGSNKGKAINLYAKGPNHFISFVNFSEINIAGFEYGIYLKSEKPPGEEYSFINGNRFTNITLDNCLTGIAIDSSISVPNESTGNQFTGIQIQLTEKTEKAIYVSGSDNYFEAMIWDPHEIDQTVSLIEFSPESMRSYLRTNLESDYIEDNGESNNLTYYSAIEKN
ncbi:glycosyl hydrolase family 28-related protein [Metabacillus idriensis]|uniref:glycosyl hydrolase family 28-related protein n=1 Tax=Metabacillus idriensis TaxID=324768 RepID=UPI002812DCEC|nr:glycosyl hydrolase family 28-related protein [Metabacillus idriensis]MDR0139300.1 glycosyl hydrolase family 28-related protein [Metabacillus idriensis]